eukprot:COSAG04_NODE_2444_length_4114_cov_287.105604_2_plen_590_part_00
MLAAERIESQKARDERNASKSAEDFAKQNQKDAELALANIEAENKELQNKELQILTRHASEVEGINKTHTEAMDTLRREHAGALKEVHGERDAQIAKIQGENDQKQKQLQHQIDELRAEKEQLEADKETLSQDITTEKTQHVKLAAQHRALQAAQQSHQKELVAIRISLRKVVDTMTNRIEEIKDKGIKAVPEPDQAARDMAQAKRILTGSDSRAASGPQQASGTAARRASSDGSAATSANIVVEVRAGGPEAGFVCDNMQRVTRVEGGGAAQLAGVQLEMRLRSCRIDNQATQPIDPGTPWKDLQNLFKSGPELRIFTFSRVAPAPDFNPGDAVEVFSVSERLAGRQPWFPGVVLAQPQRTGGKNVDVAYQLTAGPRFSGNDKVVAEYERYKTIDASDDRLIRRPRAFLQEEGTPPERCQPVVSEPLVAPAEVAPAEVAQVVELVRTAVGNVVESAVGHAEECAKLREHVDTRQAASDRATEELKKIQKDLQQKVSDAETAQEEQHRATMDLAQGAADQEGSLVQVRGPDLADPSTVLRKHCAKSFQDLMKGRANPTGTGPGTRKASKRPLQIPRHMLTRADGTVWCE